MLAEGILLCKLDQINADRKGKRNLVARKKIDLQLVHVSEC